MLGIALALLASVLFGISVAIFKYSMGALKTFTIQGMVKNKRWLLALAVGLAGVVVYVMAMIVAPLSTVQPILSFSMLIPVLVGAALFKEKLEVWRWLCVLVLLAGIFLVSLY
ncbi:MAG: hypothetical protein ACE5FW_01790 [Candidatus Aenigmatarchaeota archaeon]